MKLLLSVVTRVQWEIEQISTLISEREISWNKHGLCLQQQKRTLVCYNLNRDEGKRVALEVTNLALKCIGNVFNVSWDYNKFQARLPSPWIPSGLNNLESTEIKANYKVIELSNASNYDKYDTQINQSASLCANALIDLVLPLELHLNQMGGNTEIAISIWC